MAVAPLHTECVLDTPVQFFKSPDGNGLPWTSLDDLAKTFGFTSEQRTLFLQKLQSRKDLSGVATSAAAHGPVVILPHPRALQLIDAIFQARDIDYDTKERIVDGYTRGLAAALDKLHAHLPPIDRAKAALAAYHHSWS